MAATSQTIGPLADGDRELFEPVAPTVTYWSVRDREWSGAFLSDLGVAWAQTLDDAIDLPYRSVDVGAEPNLGLSLRDWDTDSTREAVRRALEVLGAGWRIHLIPHLVESADGLDLARMRSLGTGIGYGYKFFCEQGPRFDITAKSLTAAMDLVVATRYHAAVFAASTGVPCLALHDSRYYKQKMEGLSSWPTAGLRVIDSASPVAIEAVAELAGLGRTAKSELSIPTHMGDALRALENAFRR